MTSDGQAPASQQEQDTPAGAEREPAGQETPPAAAQGDSDPPEETRDTPQSAWDTRRELYRHSPGIMLGDSASLGGSVVGGAQHGVSGGSVDGDVVMGGKTVHQVLVGQHSVHASGEVREGELAGVAATFVDGGEEDDVFATALERLRSDRVTVLTGAAATGRGTAALMLLRRLGAAPVRALDPNIAPGQLREQLTGAGGYLLCDLTTGRDRPLREHHLRAACEELRASDAYLVITTGPGPVLDGLPTLAWRPPEPTAMLRAHLGPLVPDGEAREELLQLPAVTAFLREDHRPAEVAGFARAVADHHSGTASRATLEDYASASVEAQVREWFDAPETSLTLHDKAFLVSLAAFDGSPFPLTTELSDQLFAQLLRTEDPDASPRVPVFSTSTANRLDLARAERYEELEETEWGPVHQTMARFRNRHLPLELLREVWTGHPSARPGLVAWLKRLAHDGRPLVRTRAAATAAVLAEADLPSTMALLIEHWARARQYRTRVAAVTALTLAHRLGAPNVPRVLRNWCTDEDTDPALRWTAVRTYALAGEDFPREALSALLTAARLLADQDPGPRVDEQADTIAESIAVLLLSDAGEQVLSELVPLLSERRLIRGVVQQAFVDACQQTDGGEGTGRPLLLDRYAHAALHGRDGLAGAYQQSLATLWHRVLNDRRHTRSALEALRTWVRLVDRDEEAEWALAWLLHSLLVTAEDRQRLTHSLRTLRAADGGPPPAAAARLLDSLTTAPDTVTPTSEAFPERL